MKINKTATDSQKISNAPETAPKQEVKKRRFHLQIFNQDGIGLYLMMLSKVALLIRNTLVQDVLRESYMQTTEDLRFYAEKVKYFNYHKETGSWLSPNPERLWQNLKPQIDSLRPWPKNR